MTQLKVIPLDFTIEYSNFAIVKKGRKTSYYFKGKKVNPKNSSVYRWLINSFNIKEIINMGGINDPAKRV